MVSNYGHFNVKQRSTEGLSYSFPISEILYSYWTLFKPPKQVPIPYPCYLGHMGFYDCSQIKYIEMKKSNSVKLIFKVLSTTQNIDNQWGLYKFGTD